MDGNPETCGKEGVCDAEPGDTVLFQPGIYTWPFNQVYSLNINLPITVRGLNKLTTIITRDDTPYSGILVKVNSSGASVENLTLQDDYALISFRYPQTPNSSGSADSLILQIADILAEWNNEHDSQEEIPQISITRTEFSDALIAQHYNKLSHEVTDESRHIKFSNNLYRRIRGLIVDAMGVERENGLYVLGQDTWTDNEITDSEALVLEEFYEGFGTVWIRIIAFC